MPPSANERHHQLWGAWRDELRRRRAEGDLAWIEERLHDRFPEWGRHYCSSCGENTPLFRPDRACALCGTPYSNESDKSAPRPSAPPHDAGGTFIPCPFCGHRVEARVSLYLRLDHEANATVMSVALDEITCAVCGRTRALPHPDHYRLLEQINELECDLLAD